MSISGNTDMRWSIADGVVKDRDGENEDGEQRILFETGGGDGDDCKSSKKLDLLPHTTADMLRQKKIKFLSTAATTTTTILLPPPRSYRFQKQQKKIKKKKI